MCNGLKINRDEETVTKIDSNPRSRAPVYEPISLQNEADYFLPSAASKNGTCTATASETAVLELEDDKIGSLSSIDQAQTFEDKAETEKVTEPEPPTPPVLPIFVEKEHKLERKSASKRKSSRVGLF